MMDMIFDLLFSGMAVFNTGMLFFMGGVFATIGEAMIMMDVLARRNSKTVQGQIVALEMSERKPYTMYYPIYRYRNHDGEMVETKASWDSNTILNNLPGRKHWLLIRKDKPGTVQKNSYILSYIGLFFLLPGIFIIYQGYQTIETTKTYMILAIAGIIYVLYRITKKFPANAWAKIKEEYNKARASGKPLIDQVSVSDGNDNRNIKSQRMTDADINKVIKKDKRSFMISILVLAALSSITGYFAQRSANFMLELQMAGYKTQGRIVDFNVSSDSDSTTYTAVFEFQDTTGKDIRVKDSFGSSHPTLKRGEMVDILYKAQKPEDAIIDRGIWNWFLSGLLGAISFLCAMLIANLIVLILQSGRHFPSRV